MGGLGRVTGREIVTGQDVLKTRKPPPKNNNNKKKRKK